MAWENYKRRFAADKDEMRAIVAAAAAPFGAEVEEDEGDDLGFSFAVERGDGLVLGVSLSLNDSGDADDGIEDEHGNFVVRFDDGREPSSWGPGNYGDDCWADYGDDDAWRLKLDAVRDQFLMVPGLVAEWKAKADAAPSPGN